MFTVYLCGVHILENLDFVPEVYLENLYEHKLHKIKLNTIFFITTLNMVWLVEFLLCLKLFFMFA